MTERTLSRLILASFVTAIIAYSVMRLEILDGILPPGFIQVVFMTAFGAAPCLIILKAISRLFLLGLKDQPLSFLEPMFRIYYVFLAKEARAEWRAHIDERKNRPG